VTTFPRKLAVRAPAIIAETKRLVVNAHQRLNTLGSQLSALQPGAWQALSLENDWANMSGYIPAQVQILQSGLAQLTGHISGGTVSAGILIATLPSGYYNTVHAHQFTANVLSGASAVENAVSTGSFDNGSLVGSILVPSGTNNVTGTVSGSTCTIVFGPGGTQFSPSLEDDSAAYAGQDISSQSTNINYNTAVLELTTTGELLLYNAASAAEQLSFTQLLPLVTA
jgi:hypothetical protein